MSEGFKDFQGLKAEDCLCTCSREIKRPVTMGEEGNISSYTGEIKLKPHSVWYTRETVLVSWMQDMGGGLLASRFWASGRTQQRKRELSWDKFSLRVSLDLQTVGKGMHVPVIRRSILDS